MLVLVYFFHQFLFQFDVVQ